MKTTEDELKKKIEELAILLHNKYEIFSQEEKWKSQDLYRSKPFPQLPLANQKVMLRMAEFVSGLINTDADFNSLKSFKEGFDKGISQENARIRGIIDGLFLNVAIPYQWGGGRDKWIISNSITY